MCCRVRRRAAAAEARLRGLLRRAAALAAALLVLLPAFGAPGARAAVAACGVERSRAALAPAGCPDLSLSNPSARFLDDNRTLELSVAVTNKGDTASQLTELHASAAGWPDASSSVGSLAPTDVDVSSTETATLMLAVPESARGGTSSFTFVVNPDQTAERSFENNTVTLDVAVPPGPPQETGAIDLLLAAPSSRFVDGGAKLELSVRVLNAGTVPSPPTTLSASAVGWPEQALAVAALKPGPPGARKTFRIAVPPGQRGASSIFALTVDPGHLLHESNADNDSLTLTVDVPARATPTPSPPGSGPPPPPPAQRADLVLSGPRHRFLRGGKTLLLIVGVRDLGTRRSEATSVSVSAPGWPDASAPVAALAPKAPSRQVRIRLAVPKRQRGAKTLFTLRVNPHGAVPESDLRNNSVTEAVAVPALAVVPPPPAADGGGGGLPWWALAGAAALALLAGVVLWARLFGRRGDLRYGKRRAEPRDRGRKDATQRALPGPAPQRVVNTGFSSGEAPDSGFTPTTPLVCSQIVLFWLELGPPLADSIERVATPLPQLPAAAELDVIIFGAGLTPLEGQDAARLRLNGDGGAIVLRPAAKPERTKLAGSRLFFPVRTPAEPGRAQLRCNIYHRQVLIQSRLVSAEVLEQAQQGAGWLQSELDYTLAPSLDPGHLARLPAHRLSLLLNKTAEGTHLLTFAGEGEFRSAAEIDELALQAMIEETRRAMRLAAWNKETPWARGEQYRYLDLDRERLRKDLTRFALRGFRLYAAIANQLTGGPDRRRELHELMRRPGLVQIALKGSARRLLPAALFYDYLGLHSNLPRFEDYTLCGEFSEALEHEHPLEELACFQGECPARGKEREICPSGFWGYRHALGLPLSLAGAPDVPSEIDFAEAPSLMLAVSTDPDLVQRQTHEQAIRALLGASAIDYADSFDELLAALRSTRAQVVYFYCHGGLDQGVWPYLQVGPLGERVLTADILLSEQIQWSSPRPLVFINGCHTTAVEPEKVVEFVSALVGDTQAAGVIGTEITVFEPLATVFGLEYLRRFVTGASVGNALRGARLALLQQGNPLGLVYVPFALAGLRMVRAGGTPPARLPRA